MRPDFISPVTEFELDPGEHQGAQMHSLLL